MRPSRNELRDLVETALRAAPHDRPAIIDGERTLTYRALLTASERVAGDLGGRCDGGGPVAVSAPRGASAIVAMVGCILAGRPFVPIDPGTGSPAAEAAGVTAVVSEALDVRDVRGAGGHAETGCGYLLTTSGTAGAPKLVRGSASGLANYLRWQRDGLRITGTDLLSNTADPWFDFSFKETLGALVAGASVAVAGPAALAGGPAMLRWFAATRPTVVCLLPSRLAGLVTAMERDGEARQAALQRLRLLLVSGEPFPTPLLARWRRVAPAPAIANLYGPTESTVIKLCNLVPAGIVPGTPTVPVGRPIPGTSIEFLPTDPDLPGDGELCLVSPDLALGYLQAGPGSTRFDRDARGHPRLRTGDLARLTGDGDVELVGRIDHVVKRRGVKVPLPAIEAAALRCPLVDTAAAVCCPDAGNRIVLFCGASAGTLLVRTVRLVLLAELHPAQLPDQIRLLPALPLDARAKVDRARLRDLASRRVRP